MWSEAGMILHVSENNLQLQLLCCNWPLFNCRYVLCLARTGLIFTRIQEGTQTRTTDPLSRTGPALRAPEHSRLGSSRRWRKVVAVDESGCVRSCCLFCVYSLSVSLLLLFPLSAVLLNCPYPDPPVSACFFPFSSAPQQGEGGPRGPFVAGHS